MDVEEELLLGLGKSFPEFALDGAVARADVVLQYIADH